MTSIMDTFFNGLIGTVSDISNLMPRLKNIEYDSSTNTTKVYGHTNFEELKVRGTNVSLNGHTHDIDDVILTYEEEEETNGETTTITKTKTLSEVLADRAASSHTHTISDVSNLQTALDGKASSSHTHTLSEITDYTAVDISSCAKTNANNIFKNDQTFQGWIYQLNSNLSNGSKNYFRIGKNTSNYGMVYYKYSTTSTDCCIGMNVYNNDGLEIYPNQISLKQPVVCSSTITGTKMNIGTTSGTNNSGYIDFSYVGNNNTQNKLSIGFTGATNPSIEVCSVNDRVFINHPLIVYSDTLGLKAGTMNDNTVCSFEFGNSSTSSLGGGWLDYIHHSTDMNVKEIRLCFASTPQYGISIKKDRTQSNNNFQAPKLETTNNTASTALGSNLQNALFDLVYPIGSIYMTATAPTSTSIVDSKYRMTLHGCTFELLPSNTFVKNINYTIENSTFTANDSIGSTGGEATHTHNLSGSNSWAKIAFHGAGTINYDEHHISKYTANFQARVNSCGTVSVSDEYGAGLTGKTESASSLPPYITMYMWKRIA